MRWYEKKIVLHRRNTNTQQKQLFFSRIIVSQTIKGVKLYEVIFLLFRNTFEEIFHASNRCKQTPMLPLPTVGENFTFKLSF